MSQLDDWLHRGDDPIVRDMNLYVYSMWVYRAEKNLTVQKKSSDRPPPARYVEIEFDDAYPSKNTFVQRLAMEPRVPMLDGMQFIPVTNAEPHYMMLSILFRPVRVPPAKEEDGGRGVRLQEA